MSFAPVNMRCQKCKSATTVVDSRPTREDCVRRRRVCKKCGHRFTTYEMTADKVTAVIDLAMKWTGPIP